MLVSGADVMTEDEISCHFLKAYPQLTRQNAAKLSSLVRDGVAVVMDTRAPVILCLDKVTLETLSLTDMLVHAEKTYDVLSITSYVSLHGLV